MKFKIEQNVPVPKCNNSEYPFSKMEVGDSFFMKHDRKNVLIGGYARIYGRKNDKKFITKTVDGGVRIWRIK